MHGTLVAFYMNPEIPKHITDWIRMETSLKTIIQFTQKLLNDSEGKQIEYEYQRVLHNLIQRFHLNFVTIHNSWKEYSKNSKFKYPFYLLLRSLLSDFIIMLYLVDGLSFDKKNKRIDETGFKRRFIEISNSYFTKVQRELRALIADKKISAKQMKKFLDKEREFYPEQFEQGEKPVVKQMNDLSVGVMIKKLKGSKLKKFTSIYYHYVYFSQYEHFTVKTEDLNRNERNEEFENFTYVIGYLLVGLNMIIAKIGFDKKYIAELDKISDDFKMKFEK